MCDSESYIMKYTTHVILVSWITCFGDASCHAMRMFRPPCGEPQLTSNGNLMNDCQPEQPSQAAPRYPIHRNCMLFSVPNRTESTLLMMVTLIMYPYMGFFPVPALRSHSHFLHSCFLGSPFNKLLTLMCFS